MPRHLRGPPVWYTPLEDIFVEHLYRAAWVIYAILGEWMPRARHVPWNRYATLHGLPRHLLFLSIFIHVYAATSMFQRIMSANRPQWIDNLTPRRCPQAHLSGSPSQRSKQS